MIDGSINAVDFMAACQRVSANLSDFTRFVLSDQMALWCKDLLRSTVPTRKLGKANKGAGSTDWKIGKNAVRKDLAGKSGMGGVIFVVLETTKAHWETLTAQGTQELAFKRKDGSVYGVERDYYDPTPSTKTMYEHHTRFRSKVTGRVTTAGTKNRKVGRWKFVDRLHLRKSSLNAYVREMQKDVGKTKAGWISPMRYFCSQTNGHVKPTVSGYGWVFRHHSPGSHNLLATNAEGFALAQNDVPWAHRWDRGMMESTLKTRTNDMSGKNNYYVMRLQKMWENKAASV